MTKEQAQKKIGELVERFGEQIDSYKKSDYNETLTRRDFIDPFFKALGWDIDNEQGYAEAYREVIHEDRVKVGTATKAPDYSFRLVGGKRLFFVEAKKPSVVVKDDILPAYQIRRYGWSAKLPVSIITDFEEFSIYDCTKKPYPTDKASVARIKYLTYKDYIKEFDFLWDAFSKERVLKGSFDKFVQGNASKKGTATVDKEFLQSLDSWRTYLATSISWNNKNLDEDEINFVVQQTIDRIIFLRIAEDRSVEPYGNLKNALKQGDYYQNLFSIFKEADEKYNSGLFDFKKDKISKTLSVDNKVLKTIITELYYPESPYEFSVLSVEILGSAYEQFLGKQIKVDKAHRAHIEEKAEVRKAGGVYYTPQYIVEYIVQNTVGKLIEGKTPKEISKLKIVDPACGSGSFLIGAYQYLLDWHKHYYSDNGKPSKGKKDNPLTPEGNLTTGEKKRILLNNIFGVDIDVNAVEVTKLSLLLKCMEGETQASIANQMKLFNERVLPTLDSNIKDGNSLVDTDFYDSQLDFGEEKKIKPFNWQKGFPEVFKQGGFDVVIGNPPYALIGSDRKIEQDYFTAGRYKFNAYKINLYILFLEKGLALLKQDGILGYIIPKSLVFNTYFESTRNRILKEYCIPSIVEIREKVFEDAEVGDSILFFGQRSANPLNNLLNYYKVENIYPEFKTITSFRTYQSILLNEYDGRFFPTEIKLKVETVPLNSICDVYNGLNPGNVRHILLSNKPTNSKHKKMLLGRDIQRFFLNWSGTWVNYDLALKDKIKPSDIKSKPGMTAQTKVDFALRDEKIYLGHKILVRKTADKIIATFDADEFYYDSLSYGIKLKANVNISLLFILGLLNSKLINYIHEGLSDNKDKVFAKVLATNLSKLPIPQKIVSSNGSKEWCDEIVKLVDQLLQLSGDKTEVKLQTRLSQVESKIDYCANRIDEIVYQLYELTDEEIKIIESSI
jgi:type I restriction-modification system DNA methylase subunit